MTPRAKALIRALVVVLLTGLIPYTAAGSALAAPYCGIRWGSLPKFGPNLGDPMTLPEGSIRNVRAGRHTCFDRLVIDLAGDTIGWGVQYVDLSDPSFNYIRPRGRAILDIGMVPASYERSTYRPRNLRDIVNVTGYRTFRGVAIIAFNSRVDEPNPYPSPAYIDIGLGVRARLPFRTFYLDDGSTRGRLVIDVAHRW